MSARTITGIILFCIAMTGVVMGNAFVMMMIGEINRKRPPENQVSYFGYTFPKTRRIFREYANSYPSGNLHIFFLVSLLVAMAALIGFGVCFHIIG